MEKNNNQWRQIRRKDRALDRNGAEDILKKGTYGVLSTFGQDGYPYGVPVNYFYKDGHIYFHCAVEGHKMDNLANCPQVSFTVVNSENIDGPHITTFYESAIAFGKASAIQNQEEKRNLLVDLTVALAPGSEESRRAAEKCADVSLERVHVVDITVEHVSGKAHY